jgi:hypothetical protein
VSWLGGTNHTISTASSQSNGHGLHYEFAGWSDNGAIQHEIAPTESTTYTASFTTSRDVTVAITELVEYGGTSIDRDVWITNNKGDFFARVRINGVLQDNFDNRIEGGPWCDDFPCREFHRRCCNFPGRNTPISDYDLTQPQYRPHWQFTVPVPVTQQSVLIRIEIWDDDPPEYFEANDDIARLIYNNDEGLDLYFEPITGRVIGDVTSAQGCSWGFDANGHRLRGSNPVKICYEIR